MHSLSCLFLKNKCAISWKTGSIILRNSFHIPFKAQWYSCLYFSALKTSELSFNYKGEDSERTRCWLTTKSHWWQKTVALSAIIAFRITRAIDQTCKAVAHLKLSCNSETLHFHCNFRVFKSAYWELTNLNHLRTSESVTLPVEKFCINLGRELYFCKSYIYFTHHIFPWEFHTRCIAEGDMQYQNRAVDLSEKFRGTGQQGGDRGIKKNNFKIKHRERIDEMKL